MDSYRVVDFQVHVFNLNIMCYAFDFTMLEELPSLEKVIARINCMTATLVEVEEAEEALKRAVAAHPMNPTLEMERYNEDQMIVPGAGNNEVCSKLIPAFLKSHYCAFIYVDLVKFQRNGADLSTLFFLIPSG
jgi:hypothetical protein